MRLHEVNSGNGSSFPKNQSTTEKRFVFTEQRKIKDTLKCRVTETQKNSFHTSTENDIKVYETLSSFVDVTLNRLLMTANSICFQAIPVC